MHPFQRGASRQQIAAAAAPLLDAIETAGRAVEAVQAAREDDGIDVQRKGDGSPVTKADLAAHAILAPALLAAFPDIPVVSEEAWVPGRPIAPLVWVVDPVDGTKEFIKRNGEYVVNIGLMDGGYPVFGLVHVPTTGATFVGGDGIGCWRVRPGGDGRSWEPLAAQSFATPPLRLVASRSHSGAGVQKMLDALAASGIAADRVPMGSAWKLVLVAEDRADCYPRLGPTMWWDTCGPQAVVEGAGGRVLAADGRRFEYRLDVDAAPRNREFMVLGPPGPHDRAILAAFAQAC